MKPRRIRSSLLVMGAVVAFSSAGCGGDDDTTASSPTTVVALTTTTTAAPASTVGATSSSSTTTIAASTTTTVVETTTTIEETGVVIEVTIAGGEIDAPTRPEVERGEEVTIIVTADVEDEVHVHGYDLFIALTQGGRAELTFIADIPGIFEVELEGGHDLLFELKVS